jgi:SPP1 family predicted phage head-tail adaptor
MPAGRLRKRIIFESETRVDDVGGGYVLGWEHKLTVWGEFRPERGRERLDAGRLAEALGGIVTVRASDAASAITEGDRAIIDDEPYQIRSAVTDQRNRLVEMTVEKGVAI